MKLTQTLALLLFSIVTSTASFANDRGQSDDAHTQAVIDILDAIDTPNITRRAMMSSFAQDTSGDITDEFANCVNDNLTDEMLYDMFIPVYTSNLDHNTAVRLSEFFKTETGKKFGIIVRIQTGEDLPMPNMTAEDMNVYSQYENDILSLGNEQLVADAEAAGMEMGMQLGLDCAMGQ
ncbi:DUF2059 domain-containing protein [Kangiella aquimarina]|uniref:DUF2059 domain-containing protein n=1 Tax=Kangiella aquimarina TaxID=261965 RepID=A0ABZ0X4Z5_9GAMM|nr:hypothetical protein [Kangiella aquimarina]WQG85332.1 hypothetical protein SR900_00275 [Kangiella aquimarina]